MRTCRQRTALAIAVVWLSGGGPFPGLPVDVAPADLIGPGRAAPPSEGRIDHPPGAAASALLIRHGESPAHTLASIVAALPPPVTTGTGSDWHATAFPAPLCPHPRTSRGPPCSAASVV